MNEEEPQRRTWPAYYWVALHGYLTLVRTYIYSWYKIITSDVVQGIQVTFYQDPYFKGYIQQRRADKVEGIWSLYRELRGKITSIIAHRKP